MALRCRWEVGLGSAAIGLRPCSLFQPLGATEISKAIPFLVCTRALLDRSGLQIALLLGKHRNKLFSLTPTGSTQRGSRPTDSTERQSSVRL